LQDGSNFFFGGYEAVVSELSSKDISRAKEVAFLKK
jgi:hypothetical protein